MEYSFSVCMSVYTKDDPGWFCLAVDSILHQTVAPNEIVVVVDGPVSDELDQIISNYEKDMLFKVIRLPENKGLGNARRIGLEYCSYELVATMDADDIAVRDRFEKQLHAFSQNPDLSIVGGYVSEFMENEENVVGYRTVPTSHAEICEYLKKRCPFNHPTVMFKKSDVQKAGGYMDWFWNEDYYLWIRMYLKGLVFANIPEVLVHMRVSRDMYRRRGGKKYFISEYKLQKFMRKHHVIDWGTYCVNVLKRFVMQMMMPNAVRGFLFKKLARTQKV